MNIRICERVNTEIPETPSRSWAYHLMPMGIGEPGTESLTSYFTRLSELHCVTPRALFIHGKCKGTKGATDESFSSAKGMVDVSAARETSQINGGGIAAEKWVRFLEDLTLRSNLRFLTFLTWKQVLQRSMCRRERAWCSACLEERRISKLPIYEQLCWTHKAVRVCPKHIRCLETRCPHCKSNSTMLCGWTRPGICPRCSGWLGYYMEDASLVELVPTEMKYEVFVAKQIGELIAAAPELNFIPERELPRTLLIQCAESFFDGNMYAFARFFGLGKKAANSLWKKTPFSVDIELLLKIAFKVGVSLTDLLTKDNAIADFTPTPPLTATGNRLSPRRKKKNVLRVLMEALIETPPPSLNDLAERLGYSGGETLRRYFPEVCDQLKENYLKSARGKEKDKPNFIRLQNDEVIKLALESALNEANVPSLGQVARSLGYTSSLSQRS